MPTPPSAASREKPVIRDRGDACPGALRLHAADDGFLARVRIPAGLLTAPQAEALALAADRFGDGHLEITSRGNVQLRGLAEDCGAGPAELLDAAGLLPAPAHERVRNIVATPMSGLEGPHRPDALAWALAFDRLLCASAGATALSGRFLFAFDDGRGDVAALGPDVTVLGRPDGRALVRLGGAADAVDVAAPDAPRAALLAAAYFLDTATAAGTRAWRVSELPPEHPLRAAELARRLRVAGIEALDADTPTWPYAPPPAPAGPDADGLGALCVLPPLGRASTAQWRVLVGVAEQGRGELRVTPWRGVVLPPGDAPWPAASVTARIEDAALVLAPDGPWQSVTACTGRPGCAKSLADVRADARAVVDRSRGPLPVHWSGCERRCGHPRGTAWVDLVAGPTGYRLAAPGRPARHHVPDTPTELAAALADARSTPPAPDPAVKK
ncbi:cobalamin biosynthesis protein CobG [Streptomyces sp. NBC_00513]|uniref:cobalamin biosynthesis protein CobG n=1 Tax=unclassified Streptomyces TaxID=2593676 RepID=UPI0022521830|nr:cobalamin biosynthesis protein CobG [Streptomyces sp. NBC_00424]MCX5072715.1 cobalamin biosynthesis protein CobG [Streptomyces sp. NBC_00424]WUD43972.1 cobalamin biosynthesis protein CobG [Streptomyces sp. NBC_00513]